MYKHVFYVMTENTEHKAIIVVYAVDHEFANVRGEFLASMNGDGEGRNGLNTQWLSTTEITGFDVLA